MKRKASTPFASNTLALYTHRSVIFETKYRSFQIKIKKKRRKRRIPNNSDTNSLIFGCVLYIFYSKKKPWVCGIWMSDIIVVVVVKAAELSDCPRYFLSFKP